MGALEAMVFVPGLSNRQIGAAREMLLSGLETSLEGASVTRLPAEESGGGAIPVEVRGPTGTEPRRIDVFEAYIGDIRTQLTTDKTWRKVLGGLGLIVYWAFSPVWKAAWSSTYLFLGIVGSSLLLGAWYYGVLGIGLQAIGSGAIEDAPGFVEKWALAVGDGMLGWKVWLTVSLVLAWFPINSLVDLAFFAKRFLTQRPSDEGVSLRDASRNRVRDALDAVLAHPEYSRVTLLAHSFGTVVAVDLLADRERDDRLRLVTLGSPLRILSARSRWLRAEVLKCAEQGAQVKWIDVHSEQDWMGGSLPLPESTAVESRTLELDAGLGDRLFGRTHDRYFRDSDTLKVALGIGD